MRINCHLRAHFFPNKNMNNSHQSPQISLHIPPATWNSFRQAMLNARKSNEEVIGFLFCQRHQISKRQVRYFPQVWVVPAPDCYEHQSASGLVLKEEFNLYLLAGLKQKSSPNQAQTGFISGKYVHIFLQPAYKSIRYSCSKS